MPNKDVVCFSCGQSVGTPLRVNTLSSGTPCPACRDRVLEALPSLLPRGAGVLHSGGLQEVEIDLGSPFDPTDLTDDPPMPA